MNARFWVYLQGGPAKITLAPGESRNHARCERTDEGWSSRTDTWRYEDGVVTRERVDDGLDCDGRLTRFGTFVCPVERLSAGYSDDDWGICYPDWKVDSGSQRDYQAEAAGY